MWVIVSVPLRVAPVFAVKAKLTAALDAELAGKLSHAAFDVALQEPLKSRFSSTLSVPAAGPTRTLVVEMLAAWRLAAKTLKRMTAMRRYLD